ncbi:hypothetical protein OOK39_01925 [Streptomyces sp. NBC_00264]|uniref:hypothetical protein n=1 Tax=unclassified Streptomyces TaxID=2593676 RepID=UPI00224EFF9C|nr:MULTISPECIES: hypothetical protein [unclassified Streptomyces]MCX5158059.1 hypothetical protein [Streptomyces sp. NBC_00305]MCX5216582.1 hypothetical protein [Streptomyces sp. NBC_00264]
MSITSSSATPVRSPAAVNADIRALWAAGPLSPEGEAEYQQLLVEWEAAVRADVVAAA